MLKTLQDEASASARNEEVLLPTIEFYPTFDIDILHLGTVLLLEILIFLIFSVVVNHCVAYYCITI